MADKRDLATFAGFSSTFYVNMWMQHWFRAHVVAEDEDATLPCAVVAIVGIVAASQQDRGRLMASALIPLRTESKTNARTNTHIQAHIHTYTYVQMCLATHLLFLDTKVFLIAYTVLCRHTQN